MPGPVHEQFIKFDADILRKLVKDFPDCLLERDYILTKGTRVKLSLPHGEKMVEPDGGLAIKDSDTPFLILEVAHSQGDKAAIGKAYDFIKGKKSVSFVVVVFVDTKKPSPPSTSSGAPRQSPSTVEHQP